jgi:lipid A 3-O-deacylase
MRAALLAAAAAAAALLASSAGATTLVDEVRAGVFYHDAGIFGSRKEEGADLNLELRFVSPEFLAAIWSPRPHLGVHGSLAGDTSQLYFGLTWSFMLWRTGGADGLFLDASLGGAAHNGELDPVRADRKALGSRVLFRESLELGYRFGEVHSISVMLDHVSNANLADHNEGLDNLGVRYGLKF